MAKTVRNDKEELDQNRQSEEQNKALHHPLATHAREVREESSAGRGPVQDEVRGAVDVGVVEPPGGALPPHRGRRAVEPQAQVQAPPYT